MGIEFAQKGIAVIKPFGQEVMPPIAQIRCAVTKLPIRRRFRKNDSLIAIRPPQRVQAASGQPTDCWMQHQDYNEFSREMEDPPCGTSIRIPQKSANRKTLVPIVPKSSLLPVLIRRGNKLYLPLG